MLFDKPDEHNHRWCRTSATESTCTQKGTIELTCVICGETKIEYTSKKAHSYNVFDEFPDDPGFVVRKCLTCNKVVSRSRIVPLEDCEENDAVYFGAWKQPLFDEKERPLIWRVVEKRDGYLFLMLIGDRIYLPFDWSKQPTNVWKNCALRRWLNTEFFDAAFTEEEKARMAFLDPDGDTSIVDTPTSAGVDRLTLPTRQFVLHYFYSHKRYSLNKEVYSKTVVSETDDCVRYAIEGSIMNIQTDVRYSEDQTPIIAVDMDDSRVKEKQYDKYAMSW